MSVEGASNFHYALMMGKPIQGVDWDKLQIEYMTGQLNCTELSKKYSISAQAISKRCSREKWKQQRTKAVQIVSEKTIERVVDAKMQRIQAHHDLVVPIAESLINGIKKSYEWTENTPSGAEPSQLNGLAQALGKANDVALKNLGFVEATKIDHTSGGLNMHETMLQMIAASRQMAAEGKLTQADVDCIDIEGLVKELEESKRLEG